MNAGLFVAGWRKNRAERLVGLIFFTLLVITGAATAELITATSVFEPFTVTFQQGIDGYKGASDTWFRGRHDRWNYNYGADEKLHLHGPASGGRRAVALIRFADLFRPGELSEEMTGSHILRATLTVTVGSIGARGSGIRVSRMLTSWEAGNRDGEPGADGESTAGYRFYRPDGNFGPGDYWGDQGEFVEYPVSGIDHERRPYEAGQPDEDKFSEGFGTDAVTVDLDVTEAVRSWFEGSHANHGFFVDGGARNWQQYELYSSNWEANPEWRPKLTVQYVPEPGSLPEEPWHRESSREMRKLIHAGNLCRQRLDYLARLGAPDIEKLTAVLAESEDHTRRMDVIWTLSVLGGYEATRELIMLLNTEDRAIVEAAGKALLSLRQQGDYPGILISRGDAEAISLLGRLLVQAPQSELQFGTLNVLSELDNDMSRRALALAAEEADWTIKRHAARKLRELGVPEYAALAEELSGWPMWGYDPSRSMDSPPPPQGRLYQQWSRQLPRPKPAWRYQPDDQGKLDFDLSYSLAASTELVYIASGVTDSVTAYSINDGREVWRFHADGPVRLAPALSRGRLYFGADDGFLYCIDGTSGELHWRFRGGPANHHFLGNERIINMWPVRGAPVVKDGIVYFAAGLWPMHGIFVYALDAETGRVQWVNDTIGSDYVRVPRGRVYGGLVPQGYIAADRERLVIAGGRGGPAFLNRHTGEVIDTGYEVHKPDGGYAVHAVAEGGLGRLSNPALEAKVEQVKSEIKGEVFDKITAAGRLLLTTVDGRLYCFATTPADERPHHPHESVEFSPRTADWSAPAAALLRQLGESGGYALVLGAGSGDLMRELLARSELHVVVVEPDRNLANELRRELAASDLYGRRAAVVVADPAGFSGQPYLFSIIASENSSAVGLDRDADALVSILNCLRPYGGVAWLNGVRMSNQELQPSLAAADQVSARVVGNQLRARRGGPLDGAGQWSHQYHDAANTLLSRDIRVRLPLGILWFGGPCNHNILPRHARGPRPQVAGGRQVFLGVETIAARCVYTGRALWEREFPGIGHPYTTERDGPQERTSIPNLPGASYVGSPFVTLPDAVYLRYRGAVYKLDPAVGKTEAVFRIPVRPPEQLYDEELLAGLNIGTADLGHLSVQGDFLITTGEPHLFEDQVPGGAGSLSATSSARLVVMNRHTGEVRWGRQAVVGFRHNAIVASGDTLYLIDGLSENAVAHLARRGQKPPESSRVLALDLATGAERWRTGSNVFGTYLLYSQEHDVLIEGGSRDVRAIGHAPDDEPVQTVGRRGRTGELLWERGSFALPAAVRGEMLISSSRHDRRAISILSGEDWHREQALTGTRSRWTYSKSKNCDALNASENLLLFRTTNAGFFDLQNDSGTGFFSGFRSGCTANMIAADGILNALDYTRTCNCSFPHQTSLAMVHMAADSKVEYWTRYSGARPDPQGHGINFGAPGRRADHNGSGRVWHDHGGTHRRHPAAIICSGDSLSWVLASALEGDAETSIRVDDVVPGRYIVRFHFAELDEQVEPGQRIFDVAADGQTLLSKIDIVEAAGSAFRGLVREYTLEVGRRLDIELHRADESEYDPLVNGIEIIRR